MVSKNIVDLHTHTNYSDGLLSPAQLLERAHNNGVAAMAITDHDSIDAYLHPDTALAADKYDIELVSGVEWSTYDPQVGKIHILGLFIDLKAPEIADAAAFQKQNRSDYTTAVTTCLREDGWQLPAAESVGNKTITKAYIADQVIGDERNAKKLLTEFGGVPTRGQFIEQYMNEGGTCYVERRSLRPATAIDVIHAAGGLALLAHPIANVEEGMPYATLMDHIRTSKYDGIETIYYYYNKSKNDVKINEIDKYTELANSFGLPVTGGSDFHGAAPNIGNYTDVGFANEQTAYTKPMYEKLKGLVATHA